LDDGDNMINNGGMGLISCFFYWQGSCCFIEDNESLILEIEKLASFKIDLKQYDAMID